MVRENSTYTHLLPPMTGYNWDAKAPDQLFLSSFYGTGLSEV